MSASPLRPPPRPTPRGTPPPVPPALARAEPSRVSRPFAAPLSPEQIERRARAAVRPALRWIVVLVPITLAALLAFLLFDLRSRTTPEVAPRHRAEALCFALERPDPVTGQRFRPPMRIEPSAALVRERFTADTPAPLAMREAMNLTDAMVIQEWQREVGDFTVTGMWLRLPPESGAGHWLVVGWMEGADLAVCNFRFAGGEPELSSDETQWGKRLLTRILRREYFRSRTLPAVRLRIRQGESLPSLGPAPPS